MQVVVPRGGGKRPHTEGKVAGVDVRAGQSVADALFGVVIAAEYFHPLVRRQLGQNPSGGLGEGTAEADDFLK